LGGLDAVHVGNILADDMAGERYLQVYVALPNRAGDDFVMHLITLAHVQDVLLAQVNRTALIMALQTHFGRVQISAMVVFVKYRRRNGRTKTSIGSWPVSRAIAGLTNAVAAPNQRMARRHDKGIPHDQRAIDSSAGPSDLHWCGRLCGRHGHP
jgi:hypothetical protein